jgi:biopolymer transport protein ExbD
MILEDENEELNFFNKINITPILDLLLVLLMIFIIATSGIIESNIKIKIPTASASEVVDKKNLEIIMDKNLNVYIYSVKMQPNEVANYVKNLNLTADQLIALKIDESVQYKHVIVLINEIMKSGNENFTLVTENE